MTNVVVGDEVFCKDRLTESTVPAKVVGFATVKDHPMVVLESMFFLGELQLAKFSEITQEV